jgi:hypothetical protein
MAQRGGRRQGTPGKAYPNRSDLNVVRAPQSGTATAAGGGVAPAGGQQVTGGAPMPSAPPAMPMPVGQTPEQTPNLMDPGNPAIPLQDGLPSGPGAGPPQQGGADMAIIQKYMPDLLAAAQMDGAPASFIALVNFLKVK